jgi:hypothetical protein
MGDELIHKILNHLEAMNERLQGLENDISDIKASQARLESSQSKLENDIADVKSSQINLENGLTTKIDILFDGWQQHEDYASRGTRHLDRLENKLDKLELTATRMKSIQEQHTDLLNVLTARSVNQETEIMALKRAK